MKKETLEKLREQIDTLDAHLIVVLGRRLQRVRQIGLVKKSQGSAIVDIKREKEVLQKALKHGAQHNIPPQLVKTIFSSIIKESKKEEAAV